MGFFLGIDGGGTKTSCLIGDKESVLGLGTAGPSNVLRVGDAQARKSLVNAIQQACSAAKIDPAQVTRTCVGVAGAARPEVSEIVREIVAEIVSGEIEIAGDMVIALHAALGKGPGIVVIAGTGSIAYGRNLEGKTFRAGGLGFASSDEGSGHWIGRAAVAAALQDADENPASESTLLRALMTAWNAGTRDALALAANASPPPDFSGLFPAVLTAANSGDKLALKVLSQAGSELANLAKVVISEVFSGVDTVPAAMCGGIFRNSALVRKVFYNELRRQCPQVAIHENIVDPVLGALALARSGFG